MKFVLEDEYGDEILIAPMAGNGIYPRVVVRFMDDSEELIDMVLDDRTIAEFKEALDKCLARAEVAG